MNESKNVARYLMFTDTVLIVDGSLEEASGIRVLGFQEIYYKIEKAAEQSCRMCKERIAGIQNKITCGILLTAHWNSKNVIIFIVSHPGGS